VIDKVKQSIINPSQESELIFRDSKFESVNFGILNHKISSYIILFQGTFGFKNLFCYYQIIIKYTFYTSL